MRVTLLICWAGILAVLVAKSDFKEEPTRATPREVTEAAGAPAFAALSPGPRTR
jgi:hypothetical protein